MSWFEEKEDNIIMNLWIIPRASKNAIQGLHGNALKVRIQAPPVEGKANQALIKFLSKQWHVPRANIEILSGETGRQKRVLLHKVSDSLRQQLRSFTE